MNGAMRVVLVGCFVLLALAGCTSGEKATETSSEATIDLASIDTGLEPAGPSVGDLISVGDFQQVLGTDDLTLSAST